MARSRVSFGMEAFLAWYTARRSLGFMSGSAPLRAAIMISFTSLPKIFPRALAAASLGLAFHWAPMSAFSQVRIGGGREFYWGRGGGCQLARRVGVRQLRDAWLWERFQSRMN